MAKYLEIIGDNGNIVLDDTYQCLEVIDSFPLSQCTKQDLSGGSASFHNYYYMLPRSIPSGTVVGISLNNMPNTSIFSFDITSTYIRFWGQGSAIANVGLVSIAKDDVVASCTLYVFDVATRGASSSGVGLEILNTEGKIVYSSTNDYLDVIACGSDDTTSITIPQNKTSVIVALGYDNSYEFYQLAHHYAPTGAEYTKRVGCYVNNGTLTITPQICSAYYTDSSDDTPYYDANKGEWVFPSGSFEDTSNAVYNFSAWLAYGWLVGKLI